jgi:hypothetical protein
VLTFDRSGAHQVEPLPEAIHHAGEMLRIIWAAPDAKAFLAGYMYTGVPGPDTGVVYERDRQGSWKIAHHKPSNELYGLWGRSSRDVYACGGPTLAHFDGEAWSEVEVPFRGKFGAIWGNDRELWIAGGEPFGLGYIYRRGKNGQWSKEAITDGFLYAIGGSGKAIWAAGDHGIILRRQPDGTWKEESRNPPKQHLALWAASATDVYVAGTVLYHSKGDGRWTEVDIGTSWQILSVWGRASDDVYVGSLRALHHLTASGWNLVRKCAAKSISGTSERVYVVCEQY